MSKDNVLFSIIGLLLGLIIGFIVTNSINQSGGGATTRTQSARTTTQSSELPPDHPAIPSNGVADPHQQMPPAEVMEAIQKARNEPNNFEAQIQAAELYYRIGRYDEAIEFLMHANQLRPDSYETVVRLGDANFESEHYEVAERWYTTALIKKPDDLSVRTDLGTTFMARQPPDFDRAIKEYRRSLEIDPNHEQTLHNLVIAYTKKGDVQQAQAILTKLEGVNPNNEDLPRLRSGLEELRSSSGSQSSAASKKSGK